MRKSFFLTGMLLSILSQAQIGDYFTKYVPSRRWSVGFQLSPTELNGDADDFNLGIAFGGHVKYSYGQSFGLKLNANFGTLKGDRKNQSISRNGKQHYNMFNKGIDVNDPGNQAPSEDSYVFKNNFKELNLCAVYTLGNISFLRPLRKYQVFMFIGGGAVWSNVYGDWERKEDRWSQVSGDTSAELGKFLHYKGRNLAIPFGIGVKRNFGKVLDLGIEYRMNYTRTDDLEALSAPVWRNRFTDFYSLLGFQASFKIRNKKDNDENHYDWLNPVESIMGDIDSIKQVTNGLSKDSDGDGVADLLDKDNNTPNGDKVYGDGTSMDSDGDGIVDSKDDEPFSDKGAAVDERGVMADSDNDGIPDYRDEENTTPGSIVDRKGVGRSTGGGSGSACCDCNDVVFPPVVFENGSSKIKPEFYGILHDIAMKMKQCPDLDIKTIGYPDGTVGAKSSEQLAKLRVNAVLDYLNDYYGIQRNRISVETKSGEDNSSRYQKNRKVEFKKK